LRLIPSPSANPDITKPNVTNPFPATLQFEEILQK
jgi:hypothetical protein